MGNIVLNTYLYVGRDKSCSFTDRLIHPNWKYTLIIYDQNTGMYLNSDAWSKESDEPEWLTPDVFQDY